MRMWIYVLNDCIRACEPACVYSIRLPQAVTFSSLFCDTNTPFLFEALSQTQRKS